MATIFIPPTVPYVPMTVPGPHPGNQLYKHYRNIEAGINVWLLKDGTLTTNDPANDAIVRRVFHGGHLHPVDSTEAAILTAGGYTLVEV